MSARRKLTDRLVKELYLAMSSEHFARLSGVVWRLLNEWQQATASSGGDMTALEARIGRLEERLQRFQAKVEALEGILERSSGA